MKDVELLEKLFQDPEFQQKAAEAKTPEEFQKVLNENGLDYDLADVNELGEQIALMAESLENEEGELTEQGLETVSGGLLAPVILPWLRFFILPPGPIRRWWRK